MRPVLRRLRQAPPAVPAAGPPGAARAATSPGRRHPAGPPVPRDSADLCEGRGARSRLTADPLTPALWSPSRGRAARVATTGLGRRWVCAAATGVTQFTASNMLAGVSTPE